MSVLESDSMYYEDLEVFTGQDELNTWSLKPFVIGSLHSASNVEDTNNQRDNCYAFASMTYGGKAKVLIKTAVTLVKYNNDGQRKVGYISGMLDDGSYILTILGSGSIPMEASTVQYVSTEMKSDSCFNTVLDPVHEEMVVDANIENFLWVTQGPNAGVGYAEMCGIINSGSGSYLNELQGSLYSPNWQNIRYKNEENHVLFLFGYKEGQRLGNLTYESRIPLTTNENTTLTIGNSQREYIYTVRDSMIYHNGYANIGGSLKGIETNEILATYTFLDGIPTEEIRNNTNPLTSRYELGGSIGTMGTYAAHYCPFNLILTRNLEEAKNYLNTGELPSDAFLYPFDVENIPTNDSGGTPDPGPVDPDSGDDVPDEGGDGDQDTDPTPTVVPNYSPLALTNNNLYWLSGVELKNFINWFWTDATDLATAGDLWDKIRGLYENLSQAVLNVRYMPIEIEWVATVESVPSIVVGQIEKQGSVLSINKKVQNGQLVDNGQVSPVRNLGKIKIPNRFNGGFANYSPYATLSLWLPFHGFVDLDIDLMFDKSGNTVELAVQCVYDIVSGTIQYFIFRDGYNGQLIQTTTAKMAVDIPITLQTKNERDSATFSNVSSAVSSLIGAGASAVAGSPIGLTMAMGSFAGTQTQGAGLTVKGTVGESGAFYQPTRCAIYIKRPNYNRPDSYASRVGFPANTSKQLKSCKGYTVVYNPYIEFTHSVKPYKEEIDMIYNYLEEGVIL